MFLSGHMDLIIGHGSWSEKTKQMFLFKVEADP